jgi:hypothetical protein
MSQETKEMESTERVENGCMAFRPTFAMRVWRRLGFRYHLGEEPEGADDMPGWFVTEVRLHFSFLDRLRLLAGGRLRVRVTGYADAKVDTVKNRIDWKIYAPGEDWRQ